MLHSSFFSEAKIAPGAVLTDFQYGMESDSWKPAVSWVEYVSAKMIRACAAAPGGMKNVLSKGKLKWLALYNQTATNNEQFGNIQFTPTSANLIAGKYCFPVVFPTVRVVKLLLICSFYLIIFKKNSHSYIIAFS